MDNLQQLIHLLQVLIPIGVSCRVIYCLCQISIDEEQAPTYKRRIRNAFIFLILSECLIGLGAVVEDYFPTSF